MPPVPNAKSPGLPGDSDGVLPSFVDQTGFSISVCKFFHYRLIVRVDMNADFRKKIHSIFLNTVYGDYLYL